VERTIQFGTSSDDRAENVAVDSSGTAFVVGTTSGTFVGARAGGSDVFVRRIAAP
jgi:hypothetical protein